MKQGEGTPVEHFSLKKMIKKGMSHFRTSLVLEEHVN